MFLFHQTRAPDKVNKYIETSLRSFFADFEENTDVSNVHHEAPGGIEQIPPPCPDRSRDVAETEQPFWDMEGSPGAAYHSEEDCEDPRPPGDNDLQRLGGNELTVPHGYQCVSASLEDKQESVLNGSVPPQMQNESELFDPLQTVVTSCELPDQRTALEGPQVHYNDVFCTVRGRCDIVIKVQDTVQDTLGSFRDYITGSLTV